MEADTVCETTVLEGLDFDIECGHSAHSKDSVHHDQGSALFVMRALHDCQATGTTLYPACERWANHVRSHYDVIWICPRCQRGDLTQNMVYVVGPLDPS